ncbi:MAG: hypothetical protein GY820_36990 [Gammaproteobacteria bacterium]|nr:hypothetical protein [Gammaproteobacteria bacterium]
MRKDRQEQEQGCLEFLQGKKQFQGKLRPSLAVKKVRERKGKKQLQGKLRPSLAIKRELWSNSFRESSGHPWLRSCGKSCGQKCNFDGQQCSSFCGQQRSDFWRTAGSSFDGRQYSFDGREESGVCERGVEKVCFRPASQGKLVVGRDRCREDLFLGLPLRKVVFLRVAFVEFGEA